MNGQQHITTRALLIYLAAAIVGAGLAIAPVSGADPKEFAGKCIAVVDGDTIVVRSMTLTGEYWDYHVRLFAVDSPEVKHRKGQRVEWQPYGMEAAEETEHLLLDERVTVRVVSASYGRYVGIITRKPDGLDLASELIRAGFAEVEPRYNKSDTLKQLQADAKKNKVGMWAESRHVPAWDWRHGKR